MSDSGFRTHDSEQFWYCLKHNAVESDDGCAAKDRIGPYATREEAARGLHEIHEREARKEAEDDEWNG